MHAEFYISRCMWFIASPLHLSEIAFGQNCRILKTHLSYIGPTSIDSVSVAMKISTFKIIPFSFDSKKSPQANMKIVCLTLIVQDF